MTLHRFTSSYLFAHLSTSWCIVVLLCLYTSLCPFLYAHLHTSLYVRLSLYIFVCTPLSLNLFFNLHLPTSFYIFLVFVHLFTSLYILVPLHPSLSCPYDRLPYFLSSDAFNGLQCFASGWARQRTQAAQNGEPVLQRDQQWWSVRGHCQALL